MPQERSFKNYIVIGFIIYLTEVKEAVESDRYRIDRNSRRQDNIDLFLDSLLMK